MDTQNTKKVMFIIPSSVGDYFSAQVPHTGIAYITSVLKRESIQIKIIDMRLGYDTSYVLKQIDDFSPDFVGITVYSFGFDRSKDTIDKIKLHNTSYKVIVGGPYVAAAGEDTLMETRADFAVIGEGEFVMLDLCKGRSPKDITGLIWRDNGEIVKNEKRRYIEDLNNMPLPDYESFELEKYLGYKEKTLPIVTSRGCPYQCIFCSVRLSMGMKFRQRSPENVVDEIEHWYKKGWKNFQINDDNFTLDIDRAMKICSMIVSRGLKITWKADNGIRADRITDELLKEMKKSGCIYVSFGVEGGNNKILNAIKKGEKIETIIDSIERTKAAGIDVGVTFIIGNPEERYDDFLDSLKIAERLPVDNISFYNMIPYPGTEMYEWVEKHGEFLMDKKTFLYNVAHWKNRPIFQTPEFTEKERIKAYKKAHALYRKKILQYKLGKKTGWVVSKITSSDFTEKAAKKIILTPGIGRTLFNKIKKT
ncbi:B12-binding domain-containing radical SAM protein [Candidatus Aenigmatarchaeota archaeon]